MAIAQVCHTNVERCDFALHYLVYYLPMTITHDPARNASPLLERVRNALLSESLPPPHRRREIRKRARLTQADLAVELGVTPLTIGKWERGSGPGVENLVSYKRLLEALDQLTREVDDTAK
jgi:DNA-binding XRE family transcriptional regulator